MAFATALDAEDVEMMKKILDNGLDLHQRYYPKGGIEITYFGLICTRQATGLLRLCLNGDYAVDVNAPADGVRTPLRIVLRALGPDYEVVKLLIEHGANATLPGLISSTIHGKDGFDTLEIVQLLVESGATTDLLAEDYSNPLVYACKWGQHATARYLIEKGANVNARDKEGKTPLHYAAFQFHDSLCQQLLDSGADVDVKDSDGKTPLRTAMLCRYVPKGSYLITDQRRRIPSLLIDRGADLVEAGVDQTLIENLKSWDRTEILEDLEFIVKKYNYLPAPKQ